MQLVVVCMHLLKLVSSMLETHRTIREADCYAHDLRLLHLGRAKHVACVEVLLFYFFKQF